MLRGVQVHATEKQANLVSLHEQTNRNMGQEIMGFRREAEKQRRIIVQLERERDRIINENGNLTLKVLKVRHTLLSGLSGLSELSGLHHRQTDRLGSLDCTTDRQTGVFGLHDTQTDWSLWTARHTDRLESLDCTTDR